MWVVQRLTVPVVDSFIADLKDAVREAKLTPSGKGTMVMLYGACFCEVCGTARPGLFIHPFPLPKDWASRAPSGRRWSGTSRRLSWIRYTRRSVVVRCPFCVVHCRVLGVRMYCISLFLIWNITQSLSLHSILLRDIFSSVSPPAAVQDLDGGPY